LSSTCVCTINKDRRNQNTGETVTFFTITQRHYDIIIKQAQDNYPQECGGFIGGKDLEIKAIFPIFNQHLYNKTDTFALSSEDIARAHQFFDKHQLQYFGIYHTHPKGAAIPSKQDLMHIQKYMFIISLRDKNRPDFATFEVFGKKYNRLPLKITKGPVDVVDIHGSSVNQISSAPKGDLVDELQQLDGMIKDIQDQKIKYPKLKPKKGSDSSGFSTFA